MTFLRIQFPKDFDLRFENYKAKVLESTPINKLAQNSNADRNPRCVVEDGIGYLQFGKYTEKILISKSTSQPYKLLSLMIDPLDTARAIDVVFESIRLLGHKNDNRLNDPNIATQRKFELIDSVISQLQKGKKLTNKLYFAWENKNRYLRLKYRI